MNNLYNFTRRFGIIIEIHQHATKYSDTKCYVHIHMAHMFRDEFAVFVTRVDYLRQGGVAVEVIAAYTPAFILK